MKRLILVTTAVLVAVSVQPGSAQEREEEMVRGVLEAAPAPAAEQTAVTGSLFDPESGPAARIAPEQVRIDPDLLKRSVQVRLDAGQLQQQVEIAADPTRRMTLRLRLFDDLQPEVRIERVIPSGYGSRILIGSIPGAEAGAATLVVRDGRMRGNVHVDGRLVEIWPADANRYHVYELDPGAFPPGGEPDPREPSARRQRQDRDPDQPSGGAGDSGADPSGDPAAGDPGAGDPAFRAGDFIGAMVVYTEAVRNALGGRAATEMEIELAIAETNQGYERSGVHQRMVLVYMDEVDYEDSGSSITDRNRLKNPSDGVMDGVHDLRDRWDADVVSVWTTSDDWCGYAYIMSEVEHAFEDSAFAHVSWDCATGNYSFGHEHGHHMGARHDRHEDDADGRPFGYNHGYVRKDKGWRSIMAQNTECTDDGESCVRLLNWSNPDRTRDGVAMGIAAGGDDAADNRRTLNNTSSTVSRFRTLGANEAGDRFGSAVATGDFDGDGMTDLAVGAHRESPGASPQAGWVFTFKGTSWGPAPWRGFGQQDLGAEEDDDRFGWSLAAGDFNGDGRDDLAVGAPGESPGGDPKSGHVFVFRGTANGLVPWIGFGQQGLGNNEMGDRFGWSLAAGDFDGDGRDDLAVGAPGESPGGDPQSGFVFVYRGGAGGLSPWRGLDQTGLGNNEEGDQLGWSLAAGDFNGDGREDLAVGAPGESPGGDPQSGFVFVYRGTADGPTAWKGLDQAGLGLNEAGDDFGRFLAAGDFSGDGLEDLAVGAPGESPGGDPRSGWIFVFRGAAGGPTPWAGLGQAGLGVNEEGDAFGWSLAGGDFDGDGTADLAVGAPNEAPGPDPTSGWVFTFRGGAGGFGAWRGLGQNQ